MSEEYNSTQNTYQSQYPTCKACGRMIRPDPESVPICDVCREKYVKYPFPKKIIIPSVIVLIVVAIISCIRFPQALQAGIQYERGIRAMSFHAYVTAENNFIQVLQRYPESPEILSNLAIAYYENSKIDDFLAVYDKMAAANMEIEDKRVFQQLDNCIHEVGLMFDIPEDFKSDYKNIMVMPEDDKIQAFWNYVNKNPDSVYIKYILADILFDAKDFVKSETLIRDVLKVMPDYIPAQIFMAAIYRENKEYDKAVDICNKLLQRNSESVYVLSALSRIELKRHNDAKSLEYMERASQIDPDELATMLDLAMSYFYNNQKDALAGILQKIEAHPDKVEYEAEVTKLKEIIEGRIQWR